MATAGLTVERGNETHELVVMSHGRSCLVESAVHQDGSPFTGELTAAELAVAEHRLGLCDEDL